MSNDKKIPLDAIKKLPYKTLMRFIDKAKAFLKNDETMQRVFDEYKVDINEIDFIPTFFKELDVSAKTDHGIVYLNYQLLADGDFFKDYSYLVHEYSHWLQQTTGAKPTQSSDDGDYLDNKFEQEGFQNQIEYIANQDGEEEAKDYVENLLDHHEVKSKKERTDKKEILLAKI